MQNTYKTISVKQNDIVRLINIFFATAFASESEKA